MVILKSGDDGAVGTRTITFGIEVRWFVYLAMLLLFPTLNVWGAYK